MNLIVSPPAAPQNLVITNANKRGHGQNPILVWDANTEPDFDHYVIDRGSQVLPTDPIDWDFPGLATTTNTTWTDPNVILARRSRKCKITNKNEKTTYLKSIK